MSCLERMAVQLLALDQTSALISGIGSARLTETQGFQLTQVASLLLRFSVFSSSALQGGRSSTSCRKADV